MSDLIRIRIGSEGATDSSVMQIKLVVVVVTQVLETPEGDSFHKNAHF